MRFWIEIPITDICRFSQQDHLQLSKGFLILQSGQLTDGITTLSVIAPLIINTHSISHGRLCYCKAMEPDIFHGQEYIVTIAILCIDTELLIDELFAMEDKANSDHIGLVCVYFGQEHLSLQQIRLNILGRLLHYPIFDPRVSWI